MTQPETLWVHREVQDVVGALKGSISASIENKVAWSQLQLAIEGRTPTVKGISRHDCAWRRSPLKGFQYYLWWIPAKARGVESIRAQGTVRDNDILVRAIRHHDLNDEPLPSGQIDDYIPIKASDLNPLYEPQKKIAESPLMGAIDIRTVTGHPGSGKTIAIQYATTQLVQQLTTEEGTALYVTYTDELARHARKFFSAVQVNDRIQVITLGELLDGLLERPRQQFGQRRLKESQQAFVDHLDKRPKKSLALWDDYRSELWVEIRAYLFGMALPYEWKREGVGDIPASNDVLAKQSYRTIRSNLIDDKASDIAHAEAKRIVQDSKQYENFFYDQAATHQALDRVLKREIIQLYDLIFAQIQRNSNR